MTTHESREIGVIAEWQAVDSPWVTHRWAVTELLPGPAAVAPWTLLDAGPQVRRYFAGNAELMLYPLETDTLQHNVEGPQPAVYVFLRTSTQAPGMALLGATVCAGEASAHVDTGSDLVEAVPMPAAIAEWIRDFVVRHHVERPVYRRQRDRSDRGTAAAAASDGPAPAGAPDDE